MTRRAAPKSRPAAAPSPKPPTKRLPPAIPPLETERLRLRAFAAMDAETVATLAGDAVVARYLLHVPHPYPRPLADDWIASHAEAWQRGGSPTWAIERRRDRRLIGTVSLRWMPRHDRAELGYWIGRRHWGRGYAREAAAAAVAFAFDTLGAHRVYAQHLGGNDRSAAVLRAIGMTAEGVRRQHIKKDGAYHDLHSYALVRA